MDAIEAGLVKTPRVVVRDDALANAQTYRSKLYHLYNEAEVKEDLNRKAEPHEPLPDLVQKAYALLAYDWREIAKDWKAEGHEIPTVLLTVCNIPKRRCGLIRGCWKKPNVVNRSQKIRTMLNGWRRS